MQAKKIELDFKTFHYNSPSYFAVQQQFIFSIY